MATSWPSYPGDLGGHFIESLATHLATRHGCQVTALVPDPPEDTVANPDSPVTVHWVRYFWPASAQRLTSGQGGIPWNLIHRPWVWANVPTFLGAFAWQLCREGRRAELVHAHWGVPGALAILTRPIHRRPVVVTIHGSDLKSRLSLIRALTRFAIRRADAVIGVSPDFAAACQAIAGEGRHVAWIPNGVCFPPLASVDAQRVASRKEDGPRFVTVGRLIPERRYLQLVQAFLTILPRHPSATLSIIGDGPEMTTLRTAAAAAPPGSIRFVGMVPTQNVPQQLLAADAYVSPTTVESFGVAVAEAAAHALPVIATRVGFPAELIKDGETGFLVTPDAPAELAQALARFAALPVATWTSMGHAMRERAQQAALDWPACASRVYQCYQDCLTRRSVPGRREA